MKVQYVPDNLFIFEGFYESRLYYSDMEYNYNANLEVGEPECEIDDFQAYMNDVGEMVTRELEQYLCNGDGIVSDVVFEGISSPRWYNFSTDKLLIGADIDLDALKDWVLSDDDRKNGFDSYLREKYTSYDGFMSFVENNVDMYFENSYDRYFDVLVDYYALTHIIGSPDLVDGARETTGYQWAIFEGVDEIFYQHMKPINESA